MNRIGGGSGNIGAGSGDQKARPNNDGCNNEGWEEVTNIPDGDG